MYILLAVNLILTVVVEAGVMYIIYKNIDFVYYSVLCNLLTNPALNFILLISTMFFGYENYLFVLVILEIIAVIIEAVVYKMLCNLKYYKAFLLSFLLNIISFSLGFLFK